MATEYKLSYTASEIDEKLGKVDENATNISLLSEQIVNKGGASSWNDLTDKPFWEEVTTEEILAETLFTEDSFTISNGDVFTEITIPALVVGNKYTVTFDGIVYEQECFSDEGLGFTTIGTPYGGDWSEYPYPFTLITFPNGKSALCVQEVGTHTVSVSCKTETIHHIDPKYLPNNIYYFHLSDVTGKYVLYKDENFTKGATINDFDSVFYARFFGDDGRYWAFGGAMLGSVGFCLHLFYAKEENSFKYAEVYSDDYEAKEE